MGKFKETLKSVAEYKILLQGLGLLFQIVLAVISFLFHQAMFPITIAVQMYAVLVFLFLKIEEKRKKRCFSSQAKASRNLQESSWVFLFFYLKENIAGLHIANCFELTKSVDAEGV